MATTYPEHERARNADRRGERGREARRPRDIDRKGWRDILKRTFAEISKDNVSLVAAGVAFWSLLAIFPALAAAIAIWGWVADPAQIRDQLDQLAAGLPQEAYAVVQQQLVDIASRDDTALGLTAIISVLLSLWTARLAVSSLMEALNIVYEEREQRGFIKRNLVAILLTLAVIVGGMLALALVALVPVVLNFVGLDTGTEILVQVVRWAMLIALVMVGLAVLYRLGPSRAKPKWQWVSWGAIAATAVWIVAAIGFSLFISNFGNYGETYGAIAGVVVLQTWLWISAFVALVGAEINSEMEHQTRRDTTENPEQPMGRRGAEVADTVAPSP